MTYRGHIKNGVAVLDEPITLPDGTPVRVEVEGVDSDFWQSKSVDELASEQGVLPLGRIQDLAIDWPQEDSLDEFLSMVREVRR